MKPLVSLIGLLLGVVCLTLALCPGALAAGDDWKPVDPAELALKAPVVEKDADAEALSWEVRVDDGDVGELVLTHPSANSSAPTSRSKTSPRAPSSPTARSSS